MRRSWTALAFAGLTLAVSALAIGQVRAVPLVPAAAASAVLAPAGSVVQAQDAALAPTSCIRCHSDAELFEPEEVIVVEGYRQDVHTSVGLSCHDCHGGNPDPELFEDFSAAMDEDFAEHPYRGATAPIDQPALCGTCHSDAAYMRRFAPAARVDQVTEYWTSHHGARLASGDENVARCTSCHGVHGIRAVDDPESSVYPTNVAATCDRCHGDAQRMADYTLDDDRPLPTNQFARWRQSVHGVALNEREDISAPTCNDCHGNHGAAPPGVDSVAFVCGQCHGRQAALFRNSPKSSGFAEHEEFLLDAGDEGCAACHDPEEPQSQLQGIHGFGECAACHGNHDVIRPTVAMLSPLPETPCAFCHEGVGPAIGEVHELGGRESHYELAREGLLARAAGDGLEGDARFDWLVDRALELGTHTRPASDGGIVPRPEFSRLFEKFRIGRTSYQISGEAAGRPVIRCNSCHAAEEIIGDSAVGRGVASGMLAKMRELTTSVARAERALLAARRGGVETRGAQEAVDQAIDARIALDVLVHSFALDGDFSQRHEEGMEHARAALVAGELALDELDTRHRGLYWALLAIGFFLVALALKIREISGADGADDEPSA